MRFFCIVLLLEISNKSQLKPVNIFNVPKYDPQLVIVEHVSSFFTLPEVTLRQEATSKRESFVTILWILLKGFVKKKKKVIRVTDCIIFIHYLFPVEYFPLCFSTCPGGWKNLQHFLAHTMEQLRLYVQKSLLHNTTHSLSDSSFLR